jgi:hypothetical protein
MLRRVVLQKLADVSDVLAVSIIKAIYGDRLDDRGRQQAPLKRRPVSTRLHGATFQTIIPNVVVSG